MALHLQSLCLHSGHNDKLTYNLFYTGDLQSAVFVLSTLLHSLQVNSNTTLVFTLHNVGLTI